MHRGFWGKLAKPFLMLAPMADVTDPAFRRIIAKYGKFTRPDGTRGDGPDALWTEFVSADGLFLADEKGKEKIKKDLLYTDAERPIVAQFFSSRPDMIFKAAAYTAESGFDGFDINMGCPDRSVEKQGAGAALIKNPKLAQELVDAAKEGIASAGSHIPVSVKTRLGYNTNVLEEWLPVLLETEPAAVIIHARTRKEMSKVPAHWDEIKKAVLIRDRLKSETFIVGNGDVLDIPDARKKARETGCDGVMLGKAIFGNPWLFNDDRKEITIEEKLTVMIEHTKLFEELLGDVKSFAVMKKHYKAYISGWNGAKELRMKLMEANNASDVEQTVNDYLSSKKTVLVA